MKPELSPRQAEICRLIADGKQDKEIAAKLGCSYSAVRRHFDAACVRLGAVGRGGLAAAYLKAVAIGEITNGEIANYRTKKKRAKMRATI